MIACTLEISPELVAKLRTFAPELERRMRLRMLDKADDIADSARQRAPYQTGTLRRSIESDIDQQAGDVIVAATAPYARRIEYGFVGSDSRGRNYHQAAKPYMRPAWDEHRAGIAAVASETTREVANAWFRQFVAL